MKIDNGLSSKAKKVVTVAWRGVARQATEEGGDRDLAAEQQTWLTNAINSKEFTLINLQVNTIPGFEFTHGVWYKNPWVSTGVIATLNLGLRLEQRGLAVYKGHSDRDVWYSPPDYLQKLKASLSDRKQATAR